MQDKDIVLSVEIKCKECKKVMGIVIFESKKRGMLAIRDIKLRSAYCPDCAKRLSI